MKGLNLCDGSFRTEPLLPSEQTSTCYITQVATVPWVYAKTLQRRGFQKVKLPVLEKQLSKGLLLDEHHGVDFSSMLNMWFC